MNVNSRRASETIFLWYLGKFLKNIYADLGYKRCEKGESALNVKCVQLAAFTAGEMLQQAAKQCQEEAL